MAWSCPHEVYAGTWTDPYTGQRRTFTNLKDPVQARQIPIDHIVALGVAHRYGARGWTAEQRLVFANYLQGDAPVPVILTVAAAVRVPSDVRHVGPVSGSFLSGCERAPA